MKLLKKFWVWAVLIPLTFLAMWHVVFSFEGFALLSTTFFIIITINAPLFFIGAYFVYKLISISRWGRSRSWKKVAASFVTSALLFLLAYYFYYTIYYYFEVRCDGCVQYTDPVIIDESIHQTN